jgi:Glycosyl hydrolases family 31
VRVAAKSPYESNCQCRPQAVAAKKPRESRAFAVALVLEEAARERSLNLPKGVWFDYWTGRRYEGGRDVTLDVTLSSLPIFVRAGGAVFHRPVVQHVGEIEQNTELRMTLYPADGARDELYEDDGLSMASRKAIIRFVGLSGPRVRLAHVSSSAHRTKGGGLGVVPAP